VVDRIALIVSPVFGVSVSNYLAVEEARSEDSLELDLLGGFPCIHGGLLWFVVQRVPWESFLGGVQLVPEV
jgi:hypothetical protein